MRLRGWRIDRSYLPLPPLENRSCALEIEVGGGTEAGLSRATHREQYEGTLPWSFRSLLSPANRLGTHAQE